MADFSDALRAVREGKGAYRAEWRANGYQAVLRLRVLKFPVLYMDDPEKGPSGVFAGAHNDLLAGDWAVEDAS